MASPSWLAWSPWQITSAWPRHRQPPNPGRVALKGLNAKPLRSAHHIASAAARRSLASSHPRQETHGPTRDVGESATEEDEDETQATLFVLFDRGFVRRRRTRTRWVIRPTRHTSLPFVSQVLMLNQTAQHTAENGTFAVRRCGFSLARSPLNALISQVYPSDFSRKPLLCLRRSQHILKSCLCNQKGQKHTSGVLDF